MVEAVGRNEDPNLPGRAGADVSGNGDDQPLARRLGSIRLRNVGVPGSLQSRVPVSEAVVLPDGRRRRRHDVDQRAVGLGDERRVDAVLRALQGVEMVAQGRPVLRREFVLADRGNQRVAPRIRLDEPFEALHLPAHVVRTQRRRQAHSLLGVPLDCVAGKRDAEVRQKSERNDADDRKDPAELKGRKPHEPARLSHQCPSRSSSTTEASSSGLKGLGRKRLTPASIAASRS